MTTPSPYPAPDFRRRDSSGAGFVSVILHLECLSHLSSPIALCSSAVFIVNQLISFILQASLFFFCGPPSPPAPHDIMFFSSIIRSAGSTQVRSRISALTLVRFCFGDQRQNKDLPHSVKGTFREETTVCIFIRSLTISIYTNTKMPHPDPAERWEAPLGTSSPSFTHTVTSL